jgi:aspartyl/asparaginyl beta-hydroxylase (cupin superfamily)
MLEDNWRTIRDEGVALYDPKKGAFVPEEEGLREKGDWKQFTMFFQGRKDKNACSKAPKTCRLVERIPDAAGCRRGQVAELVFILDSSFSSKLFIIGLVQVLLYLTLVVLSFRSSFQ